MAQSGIASSLNALAALAFGGYMIYGAFTDDNWTLTNPSYSNLQAKLKFLPASKNLTAENREVGAAFVVLWICCFLFFIYGFISGAYLYDGTSRINDQTLKELQKEGAKAAERII